MPDPSPASWRESILAEALGSVDFDAGVRLVGILFEHRVVFSKRFWDLLGDQAVRLPLEALEPQAAAQLIGSVFGLDCDALFLDFNRHWATMKDDPDVRRLIARIESHKYVERLEKWE